MKARWLPVFVLSTALILLLTPLTGGTIPSSAQGASDTTGTSGVSSPVVQTVGAVAPELRQIAYHSDIDGDYEIYVMDEYGSYIRRITDNDCADTTPGWSPDNSKIVFVSDCGGSRDVYVTDADGEGPIEPLTTGMDQASGPRYSPDGTKIAFQAFEAGNWGIYVMDSNGDNLINLTHNQNDWAPDWSPDGSQIAFHSYRSGNAYLYVMDADGEPVQLVRASSSYFPEWSPDGSQFAVLDGSRRLYIFEPSTNTTTGLTSYGVNHHDWALNSTSIAFSATLDGQHDLFRIESDGTGLVQLTDDTANVGSPAWSLPEEPLPIVLVHGWLGMADDPECDGVDLDEYFGLIDNDLMAAGYDVFYADLYSSPCYTPPLIENVFNLEMAITEAKAETGQDRVILIAHSMGGLVSRAYMEDPGRYGGDVEALFTFGSPHWGVPTDFLCNQFTPPGMTLGEYCQDYQPAVCDFSVLGMARFNLEHLFRAPGVTYHMISGDAPLVPRSVLGYVAGRLLLGGDDGAVQTSSGRFVLGGVLDRWTTDEVHRSPFGPRSYFIRDGGQSTSYTECLKPVLIERSTNVCGDIGILDIRTSEESTAPQHTPFEYGTLFSGETVTHTISLEGGPTLFASRWQTATVEYWLVDPSDQLIDPAYAASYPELVTYYADATSAAYDVPAADAGEWKLVLHAPSVPVSGSSYSVFAAFDSDLQLSADMDKDWYKPGSTATITATLSDPAASAIITGTVLYADGVTQTLALSQQGAGQYEDTYVVHDAPGYAEVRVAAAGTTAGGTPMERGATLAFQVSPDNVTLNGMYSDEPAPRSSGLPGYEALTVTVGIDSTVEGRVGLTADLHDSEGTHVAHSLIITDVVLGEGSLQLRFDGDEIYASGKDGPYTLTNLLLTDRRGTTLVVIEEEDVYTTDYYNHQSFGMVKVYLPLILRQAP